MNSIYSYCKGESHILSEKPCQDYAYAASSDTLSMAIVSDGHGGERYFRSDHGSHLLVDITKESVRSFVETIAEQKECIFEEQPFTQYIKETATDSQVNSKAHKMLMWLFSSIISQWNVAIAKHAIENDLTEWELTHVEEKYRDEFLNKRNDPEATFEKTYGCTLMAYVQTPTYWFAFQIGDGKLVRMNIINEVLHCDQPVPWDSRCFLNKTTSICDSNALEEFRYCYQGDGIFPTAIFLGSDGLDDSYGDGEQLYNFYANLFKQIAKSGKEEAYNVLKRSLPKISKIASKDDMSVACVYDDSNLEHDFYTMCNYQRDFLNKEREKLLEENSVLEQKIESYGLESTLDESAKINLLYAQKDQERLDKRWKNVYNKFEKLDKEEERFDKKLHPQKITKQVKKDKTRTLSDILKKK